MRKDFIEKLALEEKVTALTTAHKVGLILGTAVLFAAAFYFFQYKGQLEQAQRLRSTITQQEQKLATLKQAEAQVATLQVDLARSEEELNILLMLLPDKKEIPGLLESISKLGAQVGLENILFQPQPEVKHEFHATIPVRLDLLGTYHEFGVFLDNISKLNRIVKVENLSMTRQKDKGISRLQVGCTVVTYRYLDEAEQAAQKASKKKK